MTAALLTFAAVAYMFTSWERRRHLRQLCKELELSDDEHAQVTVLTRKWDYQHELERFVRWMPKVELHVHLDGSFDPAMVHEHLLESNQYTCLPVNTVLPWDRSLFPVRQLVLDCETDADFYKLCTCRGKRSLREMIKCFEVFIPVVRGNLGLLERLAHDFCKRQAQQNVVYTEVRYSPHLLADGASLTGTEPVHADPIVDAITRGLRRGEVEYGIKVNQILCCIAWRPDWAEDVVRISQERRNATPCAVVGVDIAAGEEHFNKDEFPHLHDPHFKAIQRARDLQLNITMHAGEVGDSSYIRRAIHDYGATRIGHGYRIVEDAALMEEVKRLNIHFEVCPTSSVETGGWNYERKEWQEHPAVHMIRKGMHVSFNSDDPAVFDTSFTWQLRIALGKMGLAKESLLKATRDGIDAAFCSADDKAALHVVLSEFCDSDRRPPALIKKHSFADRVNSL